MKGVVQVQVDMADLVIVVTTAQRFCAVLQGHATLDMAMSVMPPNNRVVSSILALRMIIDQACNGVER